MGDDDDDQAQGKSWNINHCILAGLCATLTVSAIVTITFAVLRPAQVTFWVDSATRRNLINVTELNVTIAVHNPSRRCQARYQSVFIYLKNSSTRAGIFSIQSNVVEPKIFPMDYVQGPNVTYVNSTVDLVEKEEDIVNGFAHRLNSGAGLTVEVRAQVRFKIAGTPTRLYDINVFCEDIHFTDNDDNSSTAQANKQNFNCRA